MGTSPYLSPRKPPVAKKVAMYCPSTPRANMTVHAPEDRFVLKEIRIPRAKQRERINTSFIVDQILGEADREDPLQNTGWIFLHRGGDPALLRSKAADPKGAAGSTADPGEALEAEGAQVQELVLQDSGERHYRCRNGSRGRCCRVFLRPNGSEARSTES